MADRSDPTKCRCGRTESFPKDCPCQVADRSDTRGTRPLPHEFEGRGPRCLACGDSRFMHEADRSDTREATALDVFMADTAFPAWVRREYEALTILVAALEAGDE